LISSSRRRLRSSDSGHHNTNNIYQQLQQQHRRRPKTKSTTTSTSSSSFSRRRNKISSQHQQRRQKATLASRLVPYSRGQLQQQQQQQQMVTATTIHNKMKELVTIYRDKLNLWLNVPRLLRVPRWISPQYKTYKIVEWFGHGSFFLVAVSYAVDDFLQLRLLAIMGSSAMLVFTYFHPYGRILWLPFQWNCIFVALNSWRVAKVYVDRFRSDQLFNSGGSQQQQLRQIYDHHFYAMEKTDFARLIRLGTREKFHKGDTVVSQDCENRYVRLVVSGDLAVDRDGQTTYWLHEGQFMSEMGLHAGLGLRGTVTSCCSVKVTSDEVELVRWDRTELMHLLELHKSIERSLKAVMSWDIVSKLKSQRVLLTSGHIDDAEHWTKKRREQSLARYTTILRNMTTHPDYLNVRKDQLTKYREIHQVTDNDHVTALKNIGWSVDEFESGIKEGQLDEDMLEMENLGYQWWFRSWWKAL